MCFPFTSIKLRFWPLLENTISTLRGKHTLEDSLFGVSNSEGLYWSPQFSIANESLSHTDAACLVSTFASAILLVEFSL